MAYRGAASLPYSADPGRTAGACGCGRLAPVSRRWPTELQDLSGESARDGYDVSSPFPAPIAVSLKRCTLLVHTVRMEIKHCERCGSDWCYHGIGRPLQVREV